MELSKDNLMQSLALLPHELLCCLAKLARWLCNALPANSNPQLKLLICSWASFLEVLCQILTPGTAG